MLYDSALSDGSATNLALSAAAARQGRPQVVDPLRIVVTAGFAAGFAAVCSSSMDGHRWSSTNVSCARGVLTGPGAQALREALAERLGRARPCGPGWAVLALPARLGDEELQVVAAGVLSALGAPFFSVPQSDGRLWIGEETSSAKDDASFGGIGAQALHIDAPNVELVPDYTSLLVLRADPAGGGDSLVGDLHAAVAMLDQQDRDALSEPVFYEGRAEGLYGVGAPRMPFPVLELDTHGAVAWVRWAAKMLLDPRNGDRADVLQRFAAALATTCVQVVLERGQMLILDQQRTAHGRTGLGPQHGLGDGTRRWIVQAKASFDPGAPSQQLLPVQGARSDV